MRFVDQQKRARGIETRLLEKQSAVSRSENVIVVTDPHVVERECGARDLVRANTRGASRSE